jgi:hypothetical protein
MRLIIILVTGCILIGATYAWSSNVDKNDKTDQTAKAEQFLVPLAKNSAARQNQKKGSNAPCQTGQICPRGKEQTIL